MSEQNIHIPKKILSETESLMLHGVGFVTGDPTIRISYPYQFHPGIRVSVTEPGEAKWIYMMLPIPQGSLITDIMIAHHRTGISGHVSIVRLIEQREPISATVVHDEKIDKSIPSTYIISSACRVPVRKSILLKVCMEFPSADDIIEFGSVEIRYIPAFESVANIYRRGRKRGENRQREIINGSEPAKPGRQTLSELFLKKRRKSISNK